MADRDNEAPDIEGQGEWAPEEDRHSWSGSTIPTPAIAAALVQARAQAEVVPKSEVAKITSKTGASFSYPYSGNEAIVAVANRALVLAGLSVSRIGWGPVDGLRAEDPYRLKIQYAVTHANGDVWLPLPLSVPVLPGAATPPDKAEMAAATYANGYFLLGLLGLVRAEDAAAAAGDDVDRRQDGDYQPPARAPSKGRPSSGKPAGRLPDRFPFELRGFPGTDKQLFKDASDKALRAFRSVCKSKLNDAEWGETNRLTIKVLDVVLNKRAAAAAAASGEVPPEDEYEDEDDGNDGPTDPRDDDIPF